MQREYENFGNNASNDNLYMKYRQAMGGYSQPYGLPFMNALGQTGNDMLFSGLLNFGKGLFDKAKERENDGIYKGQQVNDFDPSVGKPIISAGAPMSDRQKAELYGVGGNAPTVGGMPMTNPFANSVQEAFPKNNNIIGGF